MSPFLWTTRRQHGRTCTRGLMCLPTFRVRRDPVSGIDRVERVAGPPAEFGLFRELWSGKL